MPYYWARQKFAQFKVKACSGGSRGEGGGGRWLPKAVFFFACTIAKIALRMTRIRQFEIQNKKKFLGRGHSPLRTPYPSALDLGPRLQVLDPPQKA